MASRNQDKVSEKVQDAIFNELLKKSENTECADCKNKNPTWVSIDFGVFVCLRCSGLHRQLGPSITRVRSCKLDYSFKMDQLDILINVGNQSANDYYEFNMPNYAKKPSMHSTMDECWKFVNEKYVRKMYTPQNERGPVQNHLEAKANKTNNQNSEIAKPVRQELAKPQEQPRQQAPVTQPTIVDLLSGDDFDCFSDFKTAESFNSNNGTSTSANNTQSSNKHEINFGLADLNDLSFPTSSKSSSNEPNFNSNTSGNEITVAPQSLHQPQSQSQPAQEQKTDIFSLYSTPQTVTSSYNPVAQKSNFQQNGYGYNSYSNGNYGNNYGQPNTTNGYPQTSYANNGYTQTPAVNYGNNTFNPMGYNMNYGYSNSNNYFNANASTQNNQNYGMKAPTQPLTNQEAKNVDITALYSQRNFF